MRQLKGSSLLEAIVAAVIFLLVFTAAMELMPHFAVRRDNTLLLVEADYRLMRAYERYATGLWPCGEYTEQYDWGKVIIRITLYDDFSDVQLVEATARIEGDDKRIRIKQLVECSEQ